MMDRVVHVTHTSDLLREIIQGSPRFQGENEGILGSSVNEEGNLKKCNRLHQCNRLHGFIFEKVNVSVC